MGSTMFVIFALLLPVSSSPWLPAQDVVLPGSKAQGDILRGQGQFVEGCPGTS